MTSTATDRVEVLGPATDDTSRVLTPHALEFVVRLHHEFGKRRRALLERRAERRAAIDAGALPDFLTETASVRAGDWRVAPTPRDLDDRRVEITGPVERKMMINALNSGASTFMADLEDSCSPTWANVVAGQANLMDAVRGALAYTSPEGKRYTVVDQPATLLVRPRGWHLDEAHLRVDGEPVSASLFDFGLFFFHNAREQLERGTGPYLYLPKMESHLEARLWNDVFVFAQDALRIPRGSVRATVLIETILAAFEMEEILYELREHAAGLNAGRWDYLFSIIKTFRTRADFVLPDRARLTMAVPFMRAYTRLLVATCHRRGAHAIGGMSAFIPNRREPEVTAAALEKVREDKRRESGDGFDGTWVAHPDLVAPAREIFDDVLRTPDGAKRANQKDRGLDFRASAAELLDVRVPDAQVTEVGVRANIDVALQYIDAWMRGTGAVAIHNLMEDAATAEISRSQLWQWIRHEAPLAEGGTVSSALYRSLRARELDALTDARGAAPSRLADAAELLDALVLDERFTEFLTIPGYRYLDEARPHAERGR
jgi:malate synthase